jgi:hypothetical protein
MSLANKEYEMAKMIRQRRNVYHGNRRKWSWIIICRKWMSKRKTPENLEKDYSTVVDLS